METTKVFLYSANAETFVVFSFIRKRGGKDVPKHRGAGVVRLARGALQFVLTMVVLSALVFTVARLAPGDPLRAYYGERVERMSQSEQQAARERLGLDDSLPVQYVRWARNALHGDFGISFQYKQPVLQVIGDVAGYTLLLGGLAFVCTFALAFGLGAFCAMHEGDWADRIICKVGVVLNSIPAFWMALMLILLFSVTLRLLPTSGAYAMGQAHNLGSWITHLILPLTTLVLGHLWYYAYMVRNQLLTEVRKDYVLLCRTKGLSPRRILWRHCVRNILPSMISLMAVAVPHILSGTYIVEQVFSYPGLGTLCFESAKYHDYNLLMVLSLITGAAVVLSNLLAQGIAARIDPRLKAPGGGEPLD